MTRPRGKEKGERRKKEEEEQPQKRIKVLYGNNERGDREKKENEKESKRKYREDARKVKKKEGKELGKRMVTIQLR